MKILTPCNRVNIIYLIVPKHLEEHVLYVENETMDNLNCILIIIIVMDKQQSSDQI